MAECIHGFESGLCDICFPRTPPEPVAVVAPSTRPAAKTGSTRPRRATKPVAGRAPSSAGRPVSAPPFGSRRLYHVTHLRNLESILLDGEVKARASGLEPDVDVAAPLVRELRANADTGDGRRVTEFVPFSLSPDSDRWAELRDGAEGAQWSEAARETGPADFAVLVVIGKELGQDVVVADGDASAPLTGFTLGDPAKAVQRLLRTDPELTAAEVLVPGPVPIGSVNLIAVANDPTRVRVRRMFADIEGAPPRVVVHPPWFAAPVE